MKRSVRPAKSFRTAIFAQEAGNLVDVAFIAFPACFEGLFCRLTGYFFVSCGKPGILSHGQSL
jgi:hypothetical protein